MVTSLPNVTSLVPFPNYCYNPAHVCKRKAISIHQVNASGNLYVEITPSLLATTSSSSGASPILAINNASYTDVNATPIFAGNTGWADVGAVAGLCLDSASFHNAIVIGFHVRVTATGVSTMNRAGYITMVESVDDSGIRISNSANSAALVQSYMAGRTLKNATLSNMTLERDLGTAYSNSFEYNFIPNFNHNTIIGFDFDVDAYGNESNLLIDSQVDFKKLAIYISGANPSTLIRLEMVAVYQATPRQAALSMYSTSVGTDYTDITIPIQLLAHQKSLILREVTPNQSVGYIGATSTNQGIVVTPLTSH